MLSSSLLPKTSTPIRARVISKDAVMNGTPIKQLKLCVNLGKENVDWENFPWRGEERMGGDVSRKIKNGHEATTSSVISFADFKFSKKQVVASEVGVSE